MDRFICGSSCGDHFSSRAECELEDPLHFYLLQSRVRAYRTRNFLDCLVDQRQAGLVRYVKVMELRRFQNKRLSCPNLEGES